MKKIITLLAFSISILLASELKIEDGYVRATPPNLPNSAAFMKVKNSSNETISIVKASSDASKVVELHTHLMKDGVMKMIQVPSIEIPANTEVSLQPGGFHIMLIGLNQALKEGENITLTLEFSNGESKTLTLPVKTVMGGMKHHGHNMHN
ncbi:copper chaperone PCu(A)C [Halarcobacter sp.]|uniref:copper chaperone PCu(A)C n=1 Tax=Halarcobacter sp. TaxID=2321133 RepID=UPI0029F477A7|nr:copper chaperone PCu(A)C [Halarcobacter sp.]